MSAKPTQVIVRNLSATVVERLKKRARANGRSLEAELRIVLERYARSGAVAEEAVPYVVEPGLEPAKQELRWPKGPVAFEPFTPIEATGRPASEILIEDRR